MGCRGRLKVVLFGLSLPVLFIGLLVLFGSTLRQEWLLIAADTPVGTQSAGTLGAFVDTADASEPTPPSPRDKCFELIHVNPPRGYAYIFDACRGSVAQVLVPLPPPAPEAFPPPSSPERGNPKVES